MADACTAGGNSKDQPDMTYVVAALRPSVTYLLSVVWTKISSFLNYAFLETLQHLKVVIKLIFTYHVILQFIEEQISSKHVVPGEGVITH